MNTNIALLTDLSYCLGLIGIAEYIEIALWISAQNTGGADPRADQKAEDLNEDREEQFEDRTNNIATIRPDKDERPHGTSRLKYLDVHFR